MPDEIDRLDELTEEDVLLPLGGALPSVTFVANADLATGFLATQAPLTETNA